MRTVDLNADLGEGHESDETLLDLVSSASIACGAHAGDDRTTRATIEGARARGVAIGAHPGYADRKSFGRRETGDTPVAIRESVLAQLERFATICMEVGASFTYVKPHGAMYNRAMVDAGAAEGIAAAVADFDSSLTVLGMPGSELLRAARARGLSIAREAFLDRAYESALTLVPRTRTGAVIEDPEEAAVRAEHLVLHGSVIAVDGSELTIEADSLCVHGDSDSAVTVLRAVRARLEQAGFAIAPFRPA